MTLVEKKWWLIGSAVAIIYIVSFFVLRFVVLMPYELSHVLGRHWLRPSYEAVYYPLRLLNANAWSPIPRQPLIHAGKVLSVKRDSIEFEQDDGTLTIGFTCVPTACRDLERVTVGEEIAASFGSALVSGQDNFINKLLAVRKCTGDSCAEFYAAQHVEELRLKELRRVAAERSAQCAAAMEQTLASDPRYVTRPQQTAASNEVAVLDERFNSLSGAQRTCRNLVIENHRRAVFDACELHKCGENVGGGCWHIADPINTAVIAKAVEKCGA